MPRYDAISEESLAVSTFYHHLSDLYLLLRIFKPALRPHQVSGQYYHILIQTPDQGGGTGIPDQM